MAYAAVSAVLFTIHRLLDSPPISLVSSTRESQQSAYDEARRLESSLSRCSQVVTPSDERIIIEEARRLEDAIEFAVSTQFLQHFEICKPIFSLNLHHLKQDANRFAKIAGKMRGRIEVLWEQKILKLYTEAEEEEEDDGVSASATEMVGLCDEFRSLRNAFAEPRGWSRTSFLHSIVFWIGGMAGVGKTAIAKRLYHDPSVKANFELRAFVKVGREYRVERVLRAISAQLFHGHKKMNNKDLHERFRSTLSSRRCLIVLDDVWDNALENLVDARNQEIECRGSLILVTSRMAPVFPYKSRSWKMRFLNEEESWELLKREVFGKEEVCPPLLVKPGKKIAQKCGLPLLIIAVAGILRSKVEKNPESWKRVAEKPNSVLEEASHQISEVLIATTIYKRYTSSTFSILQLFLKAMQSGFPRSSTYGMLRDFITLFPSLLGRMKSHMVLDNYFKKILSSRIRRKVGVVLK